MENNNTYKTRLCNNYQKYGECKNGEKCSYAHGESELRIKKTKCVNDLKCFKKDCRFLHSEGWNYKENMKSCIYYQKGICFNDECEFKHILENKRTESNFNDDVIQTNEENNDPTIEITINHFNYKKDKKIEDNNNKNIEEINMLIDNLLADTEKNIIIFKNDINKLIQNNNINYNIDHIKMECNKFLSKLLLCKNNIKDIINTANL